MRPILRCVAMAVLVAIGTVTPPIPPAGAQTLPIVRTATADPYAEHIAEASRRFGIPVAWIRAVMRAESAGDPRALSRKGAVGLMQIMPETWSVLHIRHHLGVDPYEPHDNVIAGAAYIRELFDRYGSPGWIAAYNAGPGRYEASLKGRPLPAETLAYVAAVAPIIGSSAASGPQQLATADPLAWTRAPLFVAPPRRRPATEPTPAGRASDDVRTTVAVRDVSDIASQSGGLFVARPDGRDAR